MVELREGMGRYLKPFLEIRKKGHKKYEEEQNTVFSAGFYKIDFIVDMVLYFTKIPN